jgi:hypothetical protein
LQIKKNYVIIKRKGVDLMNKNNIDFHPYEIIVPIKPPMYSGTLDLVTGILCIKRDDKNGKMTYEDVIKMIPSHIEELK